MFGASNLPPVSATRTVRFIGSVGNTAAQQKWFPWSRPKNATMLFFLVVGGGGGGGGGRSGASGTSRGGGGGGGAGALQRLIVPAALLPSTLYLKPGNGGLGGNASGVGQGSVAPVITTSSQSAAVANAIVSGFAATPGGGSGLVGSGGVGGSPGPAAAANSMIGAQLGIFLSVAGQAGAAGGNAADGSASTYALSGPSTCAGAGGAGVGADNVGHDGGPIIGAGYIPTLPGGVAGGGDGSSGYLLDHPFNEPFASIGGTGGGSSGLGVGGRGGDAKIGSGGGGGGGGVTGGAGGNGGPGMIMISWW